MNDRQIGLTGGEPDWRSPGISIDLSVRTDGTVSAMAAPIREVSAEIDPDVAVYFMRPLDEAVAAANVSFMWLSALFVLAGGLALSLAAIGLYGIVTPSRLLSGIQGP